MSEMFIPKNFVTPSGIQPTPEYVEQLESSVVCLKAENEKLKEHIVKLQDLDLTHVLFIGKLKDKNERYREALEKISSLRHFDDGNKAIETAKEALQEKKEL